MTPYSTPRFVETFRWNVSRWNVALDEENDPAGDDPAGDDSAGRLYDGGRLSAGNREATCQIRYDVTVSARRWSGAGICGGTSLKPGSASRGNLRREAA